MIPGLLLPAGLLALGALLIPLLAHLTRRTVRQAVTFAALRWLEPNPRPRRRLTWDERLLLGLRLFLLALLALWLARPVLWRAVDAQPVVAIAPALGAAALGQADAAPNARAVWLAPGFPPLSEPPPRARAPLPSLLRELDDVLPVGAPLTVLVPTELEDADGERPSLSRAVAWRALPGPGLAPAEPPAPLRLVVRYGAAQAEQARWFAAAARAWAEPGAPPAFAAGPVEEPLPSDAQSLVWLAPGPLPAAVTAWVAQGGAALLAAEVTLDPVPEGPARPLWRDADGAPLAIGWAGVGAGRLAQLTRPLQPAALPALLEPDFPTRLAELLRPSPPPARVRAQDYAPVVRAAPTKTRASVDLRPWLALAAALAFLVERWLATRPRQAAPP